MLDTATLRVLGRDDLDAADDLLRRDAVSNVFMASRVQASRDHAWRLGGELWGYVCGGELTALCYAGANFVPAGDDPTALQVFADRARRQGRRCSSMVGPSEQIQQLWRLLESDWGPAREVRADQPVLAIGQNANVAPDPLVRRVREDELDLILPACIDMFTEEVGVSPLGTDGGLLYRARVRELVKSGRAFARIEDGKVLFKAEVGAASHQACQVQGVWVHPDHRGSGLSAPGMAAVIASAREAIAPVVSLYVNGYNEPALRAYERAGLRQVGQFSTVLF